MPYRGPIVNTNIRLFAGLRRAGRLKDKSIIVFSTLI